MNASFKATALALAAGLMATTAAVAAQNTPIGERYNYYVSGAGGINLMHDDNEVNLSIGGTTGQVTTGLDGDLGWAAAGAFGMFLSNGFRVELEGAYRENDFDTSSSPFSVAVLPAPAVPVTGHGTVSGWSAMVNLVKDFPNTTALTPYIGVGGGAAGRSVEFGCTAPGVSPALLGVLCGVDDSQTSFAYQAIGGLSVDLTDALQFFVDYRFFAVNSHNYYNQTTGALFRDFDDRNHTVMGGIRYAFGPKMAPAPAAAVQPKNYLVFFNFDRSDLTEEGKGVVATAAKDAIDGKAVSLDVVGHTDRSGADDYNMGLSERRANTVRSELISLGVPESAISITWKGESDPLVATADGVREAQNRRASISINFGQ